MNNFKRHDENKIKKFLWSWIKFKDDNTTIEIFF